MEGFVVKAFRTNLGLNQGDFAREVGVSQQMISLIESDKLPISERLKQRIIYRFNVKPEEIEAIRNLKIMRRFESE